MGTLRKASEQMKPDDAKLAGKFIRRSSASAEKAVGLSERGAGLVYRGAKGSPDQRRLASSRAMDSAKSWSAKDGVFVVKIQPPLDVSSDAAGRMTPAMLLLENK